MIQGRVKPQSILLITSAVADVGSRVSNSLNDSYNDDHHNHVEGVPQSNNDFPELSIFSSISQRAGWVNR